MADYVVFRASGGTVPAFGEKSSADVYRGDHPDADAAATAAALKFDASPGQFLYVFLSSSSTRFATSIEAAVG